MKKRIVLDLAFSEEDFNNSIIQDLLSSITQAKNLAVNIEGENTTKASYHDCFNDEGINKPCGVEVEI
jgi:hypothetical protein